MSALFKIHNTNFHEDITSVLDVALNKVEDIGTFVVKVISSEGDNKSIDLVAPSTGVDNYTIVLPPTQGNIGETLINDGNGNLTWSLIENNNNNNIGDVINGNNIGPLNLISSSNLLLDSTTENIVIGNGQTSYNKIITLGLNNTSGTVTNHIGNNLSSGTITNVFGNNSTLTGTVNNNIGNNTLGNTNTTIGSPSTNRISFNSNKITFKGGNSTLAPELQLYDKTNTNYIGIKSPDTHTVNYTLTLPATLASSNGQVLSSTTGGVLGWTTLPVIGNMVINGVNDGDISLDTLDDLNINTNTINFQGKNLTSSSELRLFDAGNSNYVGIKSANSGVSTYTLTLPNTAAPLNGQVLTGNTSGILTWSSLPTNNNMLINGVTEGDITLQTQDDIYLNARTLNIQGDTVTSPVIRLYDKDNSNFVGITTANNIVGNYTLTLPTTLASSNGQVLSSTTSGILSWSSLPTIDGMLINGVTEGNIVLQTQDDIYLNARTLNIQGDTVTSPVIRLYDKDNSNFIGIKSPDINTSNYTLILPTTLASSNGQVLSSDTSGVLSWSSLPTNENMLINGFNSGNINLETSDNINLLGNTINLQGGNEVNSSTLRFYNHDSSNFVGIKAVDGVLSSHTLTLPTTLASSNGQVLSSNTSGILSWSSLPTNDNMLINGNNIGPVSLLSSTNLVLDSTGNASSITIGSAENDLVKRITLGVNDTADGILNNIIGRNSYSSTINNIIGDNTSTGTIYNHIGNNLSTGIINNEIGSTSSGSVNNIIGNPSSTNTLSLNSNSVYLRGGNGANSSKLKFFGRNNLNHIAIKSPDVDISTDYTLTLPSTLASSNGQVLSSTTTGVLGWTSLPNTNFLNNGTTDGDITLETEDDIEILSSYINIGFSSSGTTNLNSNVVNYKGGDEITSGQLRLYGKNNTNYIGIKSPNIDVTNNYTLTLPTTLASSDGQVLSSTTTGTLSWISPSSGGLINGNNNGPVSLVSTTDLTLDSDANSSVSLGSGNQSNLFIGSNNTTSSKNIRIGSVTNTGSMNIRMGSNNNSSGIVYVNIAENNNNGTNTTYISPNFALGTTITNISTNYGTDTNTAIATVNISENYSLSTGTQNINIGKNTTGTTNISMGGSATNTRHAGGISYDVLSTSATSFQLTKNHHYVETTAATSVAMGLPLISSVNPGQTYTIVQFGAGVITLTATGGNTINGVNPAFVATSTTRYQPIVVWNNGANVWYSK